MDIKCGGWYRDNVMLVREIVVIIIIIGIRILVNLKLVAIIFFHNNLINFIIVFYLIFIFFFIRCLKLNNIRLIGDFFHRSQIFFLFFNFLIFFSIFIFCCCRRRRRRSLTLRLFSFKIFFWFFRFFCFLNFIYFIIIINRILNRITLLIDLLCRDYLNRLLFLGLFYHGRRRRLDRLRVTVFKYFFYLIIDLRLIRKYFFTLQ